MIQSHWFRTSWLSNWSSWRWHWGLLIVGELLNSHWNYLNSQEHTLQERLREFLKPVTSDWGSNIDIVVGCVLCFSVEAKLGELQIRHIVIFDLTKHGTSVEVHLTDDKHLIKEVGSHRPEITCARRIWCGGRSSRITLDYCGYICGCCYGQDKGCVGRARRIWGSRGVHSEEGWLEYLEVVCRRDWIVILRELDPFDNRVAVNHSEDRLLRGEESAARSADYRCKKHVLSRLINCKACYFIVYVAGRLIKAEDEGERLERIAYRCCNWVCLQISLN